MLNLTETCASSKGGEGKRQKQQYTIIFCNEKAIDTRSQTSLETSQRKGGWFQPPQPSPWITPA